MMEFQLDQEWRLHLIKGDTGKAHIGMHNEDKVFIKRSTIPMLAALSRKGITPKLIWTERTGNGDTLTTQEWPEDRLLTPNGIGQRNDVIGALYHLYHSNPLKAILARVDGHIMAPEKMLQKHGKELPEELRKNQFLQIIHRFLRERIPSIDKEDLSVVHGDVNHRNWLVCENYLYLVDWDSIMFIDPAVDIATILGNYMPLSSWNQQLIGYGIRPTDEMLGRFYWYATMDLLQEITRYCKRKDHRRVNGEILQLKRIFNGQGLAQTLRRFGQISLIRGKGWRQIMRVRDRPEAAEMLAAHPNFVINNPTLRKGKWNELFENNHPIHIEIGMGKGQFIIGITKTHPEINYAGIKMRVSVVSTALDKLIEQPLPNLKLLHVDGSALTEYFADSEIDQICLNFSDPWSKKHHEKRRLTYRTFLAVDEQILRPNGGIHLKTGNQGLFEYSLASLSQRGMILKQVWLDLHQSQFESNVMMEYGEKFSSKDQRVYRVEAQLQDKIKEKGLWN